MILLIFKIIVSELWVSNKKTQDKTAASVVLIPAAAQMIGLSVKLLVKSNVDVLV